jgi:hypothetical protein
MIRKTVVLPSPSTPSAAAFAQESPVSRSTLATNASGKRPLTRVHPKVAEPIDEEGRKAGARRVTYSTRQIVLEPWPIDPIPISSSSRASRAGTNSPLTRRCGERAFPDEEERKLGRRRRSLRDLVRQGTWRAFLSWRTFARASTRRNRAPRLRPPSQSGEANEIRAQKKQSDGSGTARLIDPGLKACLDRVPEKPAIPCEIGRSDPVPAVSPSIPLNPRTRQHERKAVGARQETTPP